MTDSLTVYLSGDAWNGDAQATLTVNGAPVGGVLDVAASNGLDQTQGFTVQGSFGAAPVVAVSFINDAYGGSPAQDRNLYLDGFTYDGVAQLNDKKIMGYDQTATYTLGAAQPAPLRAASLAVSLGVDVHLDYWNTAYGIGGKSGNIQVIANDIASLGASHVRVGLPTVQLLPEYQALIAAGVKFDVLMPSTSSDSQLPGQLATLAPIAGAVSSVEGPNEVNSTSGFSWDGQNTLAAAAAYQTALHAAVASDPALSGASLYDLTLGAAGADTYSQLGNLSAASTDGNMHVYYVNGTPPASTIRDALGLSAITNPGQPMVITETNYTSAPGISGSVDNTVQAKYDLDLLMDATKDGVPSTFLYELLDEQSDPGDTDNEDHFGLFNYDGSPKPAATAIHDLLGILSDTGATASTFTPTSLPFAISGLPASGNTLTMETSAGTYDLAVWAEPELWNVATRSEVAATPRTVSVSFNAVAGEIKVFDPLAGTAPIADSRNVSQVSLTLTDHPLIVQVTPGAGSVTPTSPPPPPPPPSGPGSTTIGSGGDKLALLLSEDAFKGDAQFTVSIDGRQVGGILTATASHAAGRTQELDVLGNFAAGPHTLGVDFLNDLWTPGVGDRNLYVDSDAIDGGTVSGSVTALMSAGTASMSFIEATPMAATGATIGTGAQKLVLALSEDAYVGNADVAIAVDGRPVGGPMSVSALHAAGQSQALTVLGDWTAGSHTLAISFLNDLWKPGVGDRNLYVGNETINGQAVASGNVEIGSTATVTQHFTVAAGLN